jgi:hypothetical protein
MSIAPFKLYELPDESIPNMNQTVWTAVKTEAGIKLCVAEVAINNVNVNSPAATDEIRQIFVDLVKDLNSLGVKKSVTAVLNGLHKQLADSKEKGETPSMLVILAIDVMTDIKAQFAYWASGIEPTASMALNKLNRMGFDLGNR